MAAKRVLLGSLMLTATVCFLHAAARAEASPGEAVFRSRCANCHSLTGGLSTIAPDLTGIVGRKVAAVKDYQYSAALRSADFTWTPEKLDQWLRSPHGVALETEMAFTGLASEKDRRDVIEFLKQHFAK
ncbi:MAG: Cytochrome c [Deltaproteobacteria bacterium]|nr:Cytochrome c [Deltaproteobacteria bacterium]